MCFQFICANKTKYANCCKIKSLSSSAEIELIDSWKFGIIEACSAKVLAMTLLSEVQIIFEFAQFSFFISKNSFRSLGKNLGKMLTQIISRFSSHRNLPV